MSALPSESLARRLAELADDKKAEEIVVLTMRELVSYTYFLVICSARNERQARAIVDEVRVRVERLNLDAASYRQLREAHGTAAAVREAVCAIVAERGKMQNPVTGSGGMLIGVVDELERGGATLEQSLALWERGEALATRCESWLTGARARLDAARSADA